MNARSHTLTAVPSSGVFDDDTWSPFEAHANMLSQYLAIQSAWFAPWTAWQAAWCPWFSLPGWGAWPVGGEPLP